VRGIYSNFRGVITVHEIVKFGVACLFIGLGSGEIVVVVV
jgi:hypothetical protein